MNFPIALALLAAVTLPAPPNQPGDDPGQVFMLQDYRWVPVVVRRTPAFIDCTFSVVNGGPTVHAELVSERDFGLFSRGRQYRILASTPHGQSGEFHSMIETPGRYRVLMRNDRGASDAAVSLVVRIQVDPPNFSLYSRGSVSPLRRLFVILASLMLFFGTVFWSGRRLLRAYRNR